MSYTYSFKGCFESPIKKMGQWADAHGAEKAYASFLRRHFCWENPDLSIRIDFVDADAISIAVIDSFTVRDLREGDVVVTRSLLDRNWGYRRDVVYLCRWIAELSRWEEEFFGEQYYAKTHVFGEFTKPMSADWGERQKQGRNPSLF